MPDAFREQAVEVVVVLVEEEKMTVIVTVAKKAPQNLKMTNPRNFIYHPIRQIMKQKYLAKAYQAELTSRNTIRFRSK